jgi:hypothetical protein
MRNEAAYNIFALAVGALIPIALLMYCSFYKPAEGGAGWGADARLKA